MALGPASVAPHRHVPVLPEPLHQLPSAPGNPRRHHLRRNRKRLQLEARRLSKRDRSPPLRRAEVHIDRLVVESEHPGPRMRAKVLPERFALHPGTLQQARTVRRRSRDHHPTPPYHSEARTPSPRHRMLEPPNHRRSSIPAELDLLHRRARNDGSRRSEHLRNQIQIRALLTQLRTTLQTLPRAVAALHIPGRRVACDSQRFTRATSQFVRPACRSRRRRLGAQLGFQVILVPPHGLRQSRTIHPISLSPLLEHVSGRPHTDRRVDHGGSPDRRPLHDRPDRPASCQRRAPVVEQIAHDPHGRRRIIRRLTPRACLHNRHRRPPARQLRRGGRASGTAANNNEVCLELDVRAFLLECDVSHASRNVPGSSG